ncbi:SusC/RagA family TonB-linked outer membrane protein [Christiangramia forsetii]|uniref:TonB-dependent outer membrane receptor n=2 Tax=Christiangramia forsetii TaxID=411153 RepID=A0M515_CHRFK|nr:SusC/RagA family TonB-linked outer membrane protein [Christiangramia forsetii]GGG22092.1 SusC/RagA family TonB-linked outer membrane protein [Christiangramia forsetii]CAL67710.1 TonB-dependent outer membrane receptor [Christiangramia forsetii KT0803]
MKLKTSIIAFLAIFQFATLLAQENSVSGLITGSEDGEPLNGVNVLIKGTNRGTITDFDGNYRIDIEPGEVLVFSSVGFETQEISYTGQSTLDVTLVADLESLDEVVVTSFGIEQEKKSLGYAIQEIDSEEITKTKQQNLVSALQGQAAGVQITNSGGAPGMSARIIIRGVNSLDPNADNQPLFVIDGVPIDNSTVESVGTPRGLSNRAADINPNDIESMSILKGAAATALYGVRAANGAVIITTKKGKAGRIKINLNSSVGFEEINRFPEFQETYGQGFSGVYDPDSFWPNWGPSMAEINEIDPDVVFNDIWRDAMQTGIQIDNTLSISGGSENVTFYGSLGNLDQEGIIPFSDWGRTSAKLSGEIKFSEKFRFSGNVNYTISGGNRVPHDRFMERLVYWAPNHDVEDYINPDGTMKTYGNTNPIYDARFSTFEDEVNRTVGNFRFSYSPWKFLDVTYLIGTDYYSDRRTEITPGPLGIDGENPLDSEGFIRETRINSRDINSNIFLTFKNDWTEKFKTTLRVGNDIFERDYERVDAEGEDFVIPRFYDLSYTSRVSTSQDKRKRRLVGVYGDLMLNYDETLFLNITARNDWTSTLPIGNNSFFYPSVNLGYVFTESFEQPGWFTFGKLRGSWAQVGKDTNPYAIGQTYNSPDVYPLNGQVGFTRFSQFGDLELKPEKTTAIEFGTDLRFFENRLGLDITWYKSNSKDQIIPVPVSESAGFSTFITNAGEIENQGWEFIIRGTPIKNEEFRWDITLNAAYNKNEVKSIREGIEEIEVGSQFGYAGSRVTIKLLEGEAYGNLFGTSYGRFGSDPEDIFLNESLPIIIGADGFPTRNSDQLILGNSTPKWIGGLSNNFAYKGFDFSFLIDFRAGVQQYNQFDNFFSAFGIAEYTLNRNETIVFDGVLEDGSPNTQPVFLGQGEGPDGRDYGAGFYRNRYRGVSENFVQDAAFIKLRNITLGYNLQENMLERLPFTSVRASVAANNIILYTPWDGFDPESFSVGAGGNATGLTGLGYPGVRSLFFTLNLGI